MREARKRRPEIYTASLRAIHDPEYVAILLTDPCSYCGQEAGEVDHIEPLNRGGANDGGNATAACRSCNASKGDRPLLEFLLVPRRRFAR